MSDPTTATKQPLPPPPPPLPPGRLGQLQRFIAPLGLSRGVPGEPDRLRRVGSHGARHGSALQGYIPPSSQTATHRTGIPIAALDINQQGTHAVLAGKEILKTVRIQDGKVTEEFNLRSSIVSYASTHGSPQAEAVGKRREHLPARDVRWSIGIYDHIIATAGLNGRISIYDVKAAGPRTELAWLHEHTGQVNKLDFDPFAGWILLSASQDKTVRLWDIREPKQIKSKQRFDVRNPVRDVRWSRLEGNDFDFAVCTDGGVIQHWDARNPYGPKLSINAHEKACYSLDWHPDGRHVISGGFDKNIKVWDFKSDNRRQKPVFQCRAPQAIRNIRWRPPCWSAENAGAGTWQSTQVATSYHQDDPRIHVWDLRRPLIPFRELDRYNSPTNDLLWASKDLLWTAGDEGMFTQTDISFAPQVHNQLPPCALEWIPDGGSAMFFEERGYRRVSSQEDAAVGFLSVPQEKLSGGEDGAASRSLTDDDEAPHDSLLTSSFRRRQSRAVSSRSSKSQTNTPPAADDTPPILSLDKAVFERHDLFNNYQVGATGSVPGVSEDRSIIEHLALNYAPIATEVERVNSPRTILQNLDNSFRQNADVCNEAALYRLSQSWRLLGAVIVQELRDWADKNRSARKEEAAKRKEKRDGTQSMAHGNKHSPLAKLPARTRDGRSNSKPPKVMSSLLKGIVEAERGVHASDNGYSSNMTTPLAKPLPDSPGPTRKDFGSPETSDTIDSIQPLPPSLLSSHSTAAAAAKALRESPIAISNSSSSSPEQRQNAQSSSLNEKQLQQINLDPTSSPFSQQNQKHLGPLQQNANPIQVQKQEERRAALRDYRAHARPIFTLDEPIRSPTYGRGERHSSTDSFPMFSASTDSSHKGRSLGESFGYSKEGSSRSPDVDEVWHARKDSDGFMPSSPPSEDSARLALGLQKDKTTSLSSGSNLPNFGIDGAAGFSFGVEGTSESKPSQKPREKSLDLQQEKPLTQSTPIETVVSSSPDMFQFDAMYSPPKTQIHPFNPVLAVPAHSNMLAPHKALAAHTSIIITDDDMDSDDYIFTDFRPIDLSSYESRLPFAWSSLPLICQFVAYDLDHGVGHAQFSTHLLMHVSPYFFHKGYRRIQKWDGEAPATAAERLLRPDLSYRIIEGIFLQHLSHLLRMQLFSSAASLRRVCAELDYPKGVSFVTEPKKGVSLSNGDSSLITVTCPFCHSPFGNSRNVCDRCHTVRPVCPICLSTEFPSGQGVAQIVEGRDSKLWASCQACGHGAHSTCMVEWFSHEYSDGACPTHGCACDCGPGLFRRQRIARQIKSAEESKLIRGGSTSAKTDSLRATPSPAVDKTRVVLRGVASSERATQSGDERGASARRTGTRASAGLGGQRKSVRLVTPGEESSPAQR